MRAALLLCINLIFPLISSNVTKISGRNFHLRRKRYLTFPDGSNFIIQIAAVEAFLRIQPTGWNILHEMDFPFALPTNTKWLSYADGRDKRDIFETMKTALSQNGLNGTACVKRILCDARQYSTWKGKSLIKDIILLLFSFDENVGKEVEICTPDLFFECTLSILDYFFWGEFDNLFQNSG